MSNIVARFDSSQLAAMREALRTKTVKKAAERGLLSAALRGEALVSRLTAKAGKVDTGRFRASWKAAATRDGAQLTNSAPYAAVIEGGRRAGARMPPLGPIEAWANRKGIDIDPMMIARSIASRGIPGAFILRRAMGLPPNPAPGVPAMYGPVAPMRQTIPKFIQIEVRREVRRELVSILGANLNGTPLLGAAGGNPSHSPWGDTP